MKPALLLIVIALLCGCKPDARIAQQQAEIAALRQELRAVSEQQAALKQDLLEINVKIYTNSAVLEASLDELKEVGSVITNTLPDLLALADLLTAAAKPKPIPANLYQQKAATKVSNSYGIPDPVYETIRRHAAADYPNDFTSQDYRIRTQAEAWRKLNR